MLFIAIAQTEPIFTFVFKITYDDDISEDEQMQIDFYMAKVVEQYSAFLKELEKKYEVD